MNEQEFWSIMTAPVPAVAPIFYRLYHDSVGNPLFFSMEDLPGNYIEIDRETYINSPLNIRVVDGKVKIMEVPTVNKLVPGNDGVACDPRDVCIIVNNTQPNTKWSLK